jgi:hypothetical protein
VLPPKYLTNPANNHHVLPVVILWLHVILFYSVLLELSTVWHILCEPSVMGCCYMEYISFLLLNIIVHSEFVITVTTKHATSQCWNCIKPPDIWDYRYAKLLFKELWVKLWTITTTFRDKTNKKHGKNITVITDHIKAVVLTHEMYVNQTYFRQWTVSKCDTMG